MYKRPLISQNSQSKNKSSRLGEYTTTMPNKNVVNVRARRVSSASLLTTLGRLKAANRVEKPGDRP